MTSKKRPKWTFIQDDDAHWYLIPMRMLEEFNKYCNNAPYWENYKGIDFSPYKIESPSFYVLESPERL